MRLHHLKLTAFQAFPGTEEVDFDALGASGLFLLHGPTGAGKTTLLDAVTFAFFGRVPGARADNARGLRCDHPGAAALTEVELEATLRGQRIRIRRVPEQERPKLRGDGTTTERHHVSIDVREDDGSWRNIAARHDEADLEIKRLLGLDHTQFCQIVLLPQGGFARFLHAGTEERRGILKELFDVGRFLSVERWLALRRAEAERELEEGLLAVRETVSQIEHVAEAKRPATWLQDTGSLTDWLETLVVLAEAGSTTAEEATAEAGAARAAADTAVNAARDLAARRQEHADATAALAEWEAGREARDAGAAELAAAQRAALVAPLLAVLDAREDLLARIPPAEGEPRALREQADVLRTRAGEAGALIAQEERVAGEERAVAELEAGAAKARAVEEETAAWLAGAAARREALLAATAAATSAADRLAGLTARVEAAACRAEAAATRDELTVKLKPAQARVEAAREAHLAAREAVVELTERRLAGVAHDLARQLADGEPCAVCGSHEHPAPAPEPEAGVPELAAVTAAEDRAVALAGEREQAETVVAELRTALARAEAVAGSDEREALVTAHVEAAEALREASEAAAAAATVAATLAEHDAAVAAREVQLRDARKTAAEATTEAGTRRAALDADRAEVQRACGDHSTIAEHVAALTTAADLSDTAADAVEQRRRATADRDGVREQAIAETMRAGFSELDEVRAAQRSPEARDQLDAGVRMWDETLVRRRSAAEQPALVAAAAEAAPALEAFETAQMRALDDERSAQKLLGVVKERRAELGELRAKLTDRLAAARPLREHFDLVRGLADLFEGRGANTQSMRLSAYVLAARLEEVAEAATVRLQKMTGGRYALEHSIEGATKRGLAGLELRVVDAWTGKPRAATSLSGGETFMASLALALGLADVVTAEAGGAQLETLFVDEGFGTLDDEGTLDQVLDVLDGLREGGRAVGIVSHVAELRQRLPVQLRVEKGRDGSKVRQAVAV